ncbi:GGDEF domain-containing protein [Sulfurospirillum arcachonense]|uniref:GGDEF domain-containing protein n=1 Tax=Sulfurospirillum arcachonense TaxID=57666 RepID=UPI00046ACF8C|nr:diguanylate cyclase [Sulfurospirillum arcachonense]
MQTIKSFHFISFLTIFLTFIITYFEIIPQSILLIFKNITIGLIIITMMFSIFFSRSKSFVLLLIPLFFSFYMFYPNFLGLDGGDYSFWYLFPITTAIGFLFIGILQERGLFCFYGISKIFIIFFLLGITYYLLATFSVEFKNALDISIINFDFSSFIKVNDFTFLISILSIIFVTIISNIFFTSNIEKAPFWVLICLLIPSLFFQTKSSFILFSSLGAILFLVSLLKDAYTMAYIDTLTKIPARRALEEAFLKLGSTYTLAMIDIDFFKKFNDTYGHDVGDDVLKLVAEQLNAVKGGGKAFRYGGEEFTILFPNKKHNEVLVYLEDVREAIATRKFTIRDKNRPTKTPEKKIKPKNIKTVNLTVSIGAASSPQDGRNSDEIMKKADNALYKAKENGRNCTMMN